MEGAHGGAWVPSELPWLPCVLVAQRMCVALHIQSLHRLLHACRNFYEASVLACANCMLRRHTSAIASGKQSPQCSEIQLFLRLWHWSAAQLTMHNCLAAPPSCSHLRGVARDEVASWIRKS
jgi:hypothetical protein